MKSPTKQFIDEYHRVQDLMDEFLPKPDTGKKIQEGLHNLEDIFDTYDDYGAIDKKELRYDHKLMTFLAEYLPNIYSRVHTRIYGGKLNTTKLYLTRKINTKRLIRKKNTKRVTRKNTKKLVHKQKGRKTNF